MTFKLAICQILFVYFAPFLSGGRNLYSIFWILVMPGQHTKEGRILVSVVKRLNAFNMTVTKH